MPRLTLSIMALCVLFVTATTAHSQGHGEMTLSPKALEQIMLDALDGAMGNSSRSFEFACYRCGASGRGFNPPTTQGCSIRSGHQWGKVGDTGQKKWTCKKCRAQVSTTSKPDSSSCAGKGYHVWLDY